MKQKRPKTPKVKAATHCAGCRKELAPAERSSRAREWCDDCLRPAAGVSTIGAK